MTLRELPIRLRILRALRDGLAAMPWVGHVAIDPLGTHPDSARAAQDAFAQGKAVIEITASDDGGPDGQGDVEHHVHGPTDASFDVGLVVLCPTTPAALAGQPQSPAEFACRAHAAIVEYLQSEPAGQTFGGLAVETVYVGGGGIGVEPDLGCVATAAAARVRYRHDHGRTDLVGGAAPQGGGGTP
jgi:hypothetical protein